MKFRILSRISKKALLIVSYDQKRDSFREFCVLYIEGVICPIKHKEGIMPITGISLSIEAAGANPKYDASAKKLLSFKSVIAWILKLNIS